MFIHDNGLLEQVSPLAEGRELKYERAADFISPRMSPLAEGRELKLCGVTLTGSTGLKSPLAEGRELKSPDA